MERVSAHHTVIVHDVLSVIIVVVLLWNVYMHTVIVHGVLCVIMSVVLI